MQSSIAFYNIGGVLISAGLIGVCSYIILAWSAISDVQILNRWARDYIIQYFQDFFFNQ